MEWLLAAGELTVLPTIPIGPALVFSEKHPPMFIRKTIFLSTNLKPIFGAIPFALCYYTYCIFHSSPSLTDTRNKSLFDHALAQRDIKLATFVISSWKKFPKISELFSISFGTNNAFHKFFTHATEQNQTDELFFKQILTLLLALGKPETILTSLAQENLSNKKPLDIAYENKNCPNLTLKLINYLHEFYKSKCIYSTPTDHFFRTAQKGFFGVANRILDQKPTYLVEEKFKKQIEVRYGSYATFKKMVPLREKYVKLLDQIFDKDVPNIQKEFIENLEKNKKS